MAAVVSGRQEEQGRLTDRKLEEPDDHVDIEALLSRPRSYGRRRHKPLYKAPEFVKRLSSFEEVTAGKDVIFECQWKAFPKPDFTWFRDETEVTHNPRYQIKEGDNGVLTLTIYKATKADEGAYKCRAENQEGSSSTTGYLSVKGDLKEKVLSAQPRKHAEHAVSYPPCLRTIIEQQSLEEREAEAYEPITAPFKADTWPVLGRSCPTAGRAEPEYNQDDGNDSDTSVESQDFDRVTFKAPLADEEDINDGLSTPSTAEPELFELEDITEESSVTSEGESRPSLPASEPPRFNTPKLRTPTPPILPKFDDSSPTSPRVETGPLLTHRFEPQTPPSPEASPVPSTVAQALPSTPPHVPSTVASPGTPYHAEVTPVPKQPLSVAEGAAAALRPRLIKQHSMDKVAETTVVAPSTEISPETIEQVTPNIASVAASALPNGVTHVQYVQPKSTNTISTNIASRQRTLVQGTPFPWSIYILFTVCCGFCGSYTCLHPFWFVLIISLLSIVSFRYVISSNSSE